MEEMKTEILYIYYWIYFVNILTSTELLKMQNGYQRIQKWAAMENVRHRIGLYFPTPMHSPEITEQSWYHTEQPAQQTALFMVPIRRLYCKTTTDPSLNNSVQRKGIGCVLKLDSISSSVLRTSLRAVAMWKSRTWRYLQHRTILQHSH